MEEETGNAGNPSRRSGEPVWIFGGRRSTSSPSSSGGRREGGCPWAVEGVAYDVVAHGEAVHAELVRAPGQRPELEPAGLRHRGTQWLRWHLRGC